MHYIYYFINKIILIFNITFTFKGRNITNKNLFDMSSKEGKSIQPMSTLFDQVLHIYGDIISIEIIEKLKIDKFKILKNHANLE